VGLDMTVSFQKLEPMKGLEPSTFSLATRRSTS
jgi:hypothetical protein